MAVVVEHMARQPVTQYIPFVATTADHRVPSPYATRVYQSFTGENMLSQLHSQWSALTAVSSSCR